jgi:hypothetical protein
VAVKVVEHTQHAGRQSGSNNSSNNRASAEAKIARELLLSTSIAHPNVIATYKICTIRVGSVPDAGLLDTEVFGKILPDSGVSAPGHEWQPFAHTYIPQAAANLSCGVTRRASPLP